MDYFLFLIAVVWLYVTYRFIKIWGLRFFSYYRGLIKLRKMPKRKKKYLISHLQNNLPNSFFFFEKMKQILVAVSITFLLWLIYYQVKSYLAADNTIDSLYYSMSLLSSTFIPMVPFQFMVHFEKLKLRKLPPSSDEELDNLINQISNDTSADLPFIIYGICTIVVLHASLFVYRLLVF